MRHIIHTILLALRLVQSAAGNPSTESKILSDKGAVIPLEIQIVLAEPFLLPKNSKVLLLDISKA